MNGSKRSARKNWYRGRGPNSMRGEVKYSLKRNKKYLNRKARREPDLPNGSAYKKLAKNKAWEYVT